ncbi:hypothetical protein F2Q69_00054977 [Brassica cretica]|uniref:Uncharacterized protein n=1 Tax=Brassica cretica TaxID=69181 RepID=A0A8S9N4Q7_BRACR|nr:hypothetical protein F2Q69_00054977 [Brassica cretica]
MKNSNNAHEKNVQDDRFTRRSRKRERGVESYRECMELRLGVVERKTERERGVSGRTKQLHESSAKAPSPFPTNPTAFRNSPWPSSSKGFVLFFPLHKPIASCHVSSKERFF